MASAVLASLTEDELHVITQALKVAAAAYGQMKRTNAGNMQIDDALMAANAEREARDVLAKIEASA